MPEPPMTAVDSFTATYDNTPAGVWSAPGRVNLIGEHTDYNDGYVLPFAIGARTYVAARVRDDGVLRMRSVQQHTGDVSIDLDDVEPGKPDGWAAYVAGVVWAARGAGHPVQGLDLLVDGRVPLGSGLSSSHALECAVALAMNDLFGLGLDANSLGRLSYTAENDFVGAPTGMMDQLASLRCTAGHALFLDNRTLDAEQVPLDPVADGLRLLVLDTRVHHGHADGAYGNRRAACQRAAGVLGVASLRDVDVAGLGAALDQLGDDELRRRVRHVVLENARVVDTVAALRDTDWQQVGTLMAASHASLRDDYEVSSEELDVAVEAAAAAGAVGARMTGGGFGGSVIALVPARLVATVRDEVTAAFRGRDWTAPTVFEVSPSAGAHRDS
jgi:galactokinase